MQGRRGASAEGGAVFHRLLPMRFFFKILLIANSFENVIITGLWTTKVTYDLGVANGSTATSSSAVTLKICLENHEQFVWTFKFEHPVY